MKPVFVLLALLGSVAAAQDPEMKCCCTTLDTSICLSKVHGKVNAELNDAYQSSVNIAARFSDNDVENLRDAQLKWVAYRDAACKAEYGLWGGGSGGPNAEVECQIKFIRLRTAELKTTYLERLH